MASEVEICNSALIKVGANRIVSLSDDSKEARLCNEQYSKVRDELLRSHPWNFAMKRAELGLLDEEVEFEFTNAFQLPTDCLRVIKTEDSRIVYRIEGRKIITDETEFKILYIAQITDPTTFDPMFKETLATRLAVDLSYALSESASLTERLMKSYLTLLKDARSIDGQEGTPEDVEVNEWLDSRF